MVTWSQWTYMNSEMSPTVVLNHCPSMAHVTRLYYRQQSTLPPTNTSLEESPTFLLSCYTPPCTYKKRVCQCIYMSVYIHAQNKNDQTCLWWYFFLLVVIFFLPSIYWLHWHNWDLFLLYNIKWTCSKLLNFTVYGVPATSTYLNIGIEHTHTFLHWLVCWCWGKVASSNPNG